MIKMEYDEKSGEFCPDDVQEDDDPAHVDDDDVTVIDPPHSVQQPPERIDLTTDLALGEDVAKHPGVKREREPEKLEKPEEMTTTGPAEKTVKMDIVNASGTVKVEGESKPPVKMEPAVGPDPTEQEIRDNQQLIADLAQAQDAQEKAKKNCLMAGALHQNILAQCKTAQGSTEQRVSEYNKLLAVDNNKLTRHTM